MEAHNNGKGNAKVMRQAPVSLQFLFVSKLSQTTLVTVLAGGSALNCRLCHCRDCWLRFRALCAENKATPKRRTKSFVNRWLRKPATGGRKRTIGDGS